MFTNQFLNLHLFAELIQVMKNQEAVDLVKSTKDPQAAAKRLTTEALARKSKDDISCIVIRFRCWIDPILRSFQFLDPWLMWRRDLILAAPDWNYVVAVIVCTYSSCEHAWD